MSVSIACIAGHPEYVGVITTTTSSADDLDVAHDRPARECSAPAPRGPSPSSSHARISSRARVARRSPRRPRVRARDDLHLGEHVARGARCAVPSRPPRGMKPSFGMVSVARLEHLRRPSAATRGRSDSSVDADPAPAAARVDGVGQEQLAGVAPQLVQRALRARVALLGAVAELDDPLARCGARGTSLPSAPSPRCRRARRSTLRVRRSSSEHVARVEQELPRRS